MNDIASVVDEDRLENRHVIVALTPSTPLPLEKIRSLYEEGLILQAYRLGAEVAPIRDWRGADARLMAGRIAPNLGAPRLGRVMHACAHREHPEHPEVAYFQVRGVLETRGPLAAIEFCRRTAPLFDKATNEIRADWLGFRAILAGIYRDFETADDLLDDAEKLAPDRPWIWIERSSVLEQQDRVEAALTAARRSMELQPWYRGGVHRVAHVLQLMDRDDEALDLLTQAGTRIESTSIFFQLASLQDHLGRHADALETLSRIDALSPLADKGFTKAVAWVRSNTAYHGGRIREAIEFAEQADEEFMRSVAQKLREHLEAGKAPSRVMIELPFVRQHHMTCAPATLSTISHFWRQPADHLALVDAICYDGTPSYSQRRWAESNGWAVREFTVTWEAAVALIDRGVPFTLATLHVTSAHLQAVIGYDALRETLICRDPNQYYVTEISMQLLLKYNAASGPRGMVLVRASEIDRLKGMPLQDAFLFDHLHAMEAALARHDRPAAEAARAQLAAAAPNHRLTFHARRAMAAYDFDPLGSLEAIDGLLGLYPDDQPLMLANVMALRGIDRRDLVLPLLEKACGLPASHPVFLQIYAEELQADAGIGSRVLAMLKKALRRQPTDGASLTAMARVLWSQRNLEEATALYYLCACVEEKNESAAQSYFLASRHLRQSDPALAMLERRVDRLGKRSSEPARTLFWALEALDRTSEAVATLERALRLRPDDGDLLLFAANVHGQRGDLVAAHAKLKSAAGKSHAKQWSRTAARIALYEGELTRALSLWRAVLEAEPLAPDANEEVAQLIAQTESTDAAAQHLAEVHARFPHNARLHQIRVIWLRTQGAAAVVPVVREQNHEALARLLWKNDEYAAALSRMRQALMLDPAMDGAWETLRAWSEERKAEAELVEFAREGCRRRAGEAIGWLVLARVLSGPGTLAERIASCEKAIERSPRNGEAHDLRAALLLESGKPDEALAACDPPEFGGNLPTELRGRRAWITAWQGKRAEAIERMKELLQHDGNYHWGWVQLVNWLRENEDPEAYLEATRGAATLFPHDTTLQNHYASAQIKSGDRAGAKATLGRSVGVSPDNWFALDHLFDLQLNDSDLDEAARTLAIIQQQTPRAYALSRQTMHAAARGDSDAATEAVCRLCVELKDDPHLLVDAYQAMEAVRMGRAVDQAFERAASSESTMAASAVEVWVSRAMKGRHFSVGRRILLRFATDSAQWESAVAANVDGIVSAKRRDLLNRLIRKWRQPLRGRTQLWGKIGYGLFSFNKTRRCVHWQSDWKQRPDASPWMLLNLAGALRRRGRDEEAGNVHRFALQCKPDHTNLKHTVWLAFDEVIAGRSLKHLKELEAADTQRLDKHYPYLCRMIKALKPLLTDSAAQGDVLTRTARGEITAAFKTVQRWPGQPELRHALRRAARRVVSVRPSFRNRLWLIATMLRSHLRVTR